MTVTLAQAELMQPVVALRARAKYVVVAAGDTKGLAPPETGVPPQLPVYQSTVTPPGTDAVRVDEPPVHTVEGVASGLVGVEGAEFTVTVTLAQAALTQPLVVFLARAK
ncbi:MAG: hypothetical protein IPK83_15565 [Planctomycetes bacterium]|nr:hypothetical protein [Planctomycetota bacterium]